MLRIYTTVIELLRGLRPVIDDIEKNDRDLARQLRRASASVALNMQEGGGSHGGTRLERYRNALGSARETGACLDVARPRPRQRQRPGVARDPTHELETAYALAQAA
jgi:four helix bundle protein